MVRSAIGRLFLPFRSPLFSLSSRPTPFSSPLSLLTRISFNSSILPLLDTLVRLVAADIGPGKDHSRRQIKKLRLKSRDKRYTRSIVKTNIEKKTVKRKIIIKLSIFFTKKLRLHIAIMETVMK